MMQKVALIIASLGYCLNVFGQCPTAGQTVESVAPSSGVLDADYSPVSKKLSVVGEFFEDTFRFGGHQLTSITSGFIEHDLFAMQLSPDGNVDWLQHMGKAASGSTAARVRVLDEGALVAVRFVDTVDIDGVHISSGSENALLIKLDGLGNILWVRHLDSDGFSKISGIEIDELENVYILGQYSENLTIEGISIQGVGNPQVLDGEVFLGKLDVYGNMKWLKHLAGGDGNDEAESIIHKGGSIYLSGFFSGELAIGQENLTASTNNNGYVCRVDTSGEVIWVKQMYSSVVRELDLTYSDNGFFMAGVFQDELTVGSDVLGSNGGRDGFVLSMDSLGGVRWMKNVGGSAGDDAFDIEAVSEDLLLVSGIARSNFTIDGLNFMNYSTVSQWNGWAMIMDTSGTVRCLSSYPSTDESWVFVEHIFEDTIWSIGTYQVDASVGDTTYYSLGNGGSFFAAKTCMGCDELIRLDVPSVVKQEVQFDVYPNPFTTLTQLNYRTAQGTRPTLQLTDMLGRTLQTMQLPSHEGSYTLQAAGLGTGVYFCSLVSGGEVLDTQKLVVSSIENE